MNRAKKAENAGDVETANLIAQKMAQDWSTKLLKIAGVKVHLEGVENLPQGAMVMVANHQGNFDIPLYLSCIPKSLGFFSKIEVKKLPLVRTWMHYLHCVFVQRGDRRQSMMAIHDAVSTLKEGYSLAIFPEGTRSKGDAVGEFKAGAFKIAQKAKVPVVPVCMNGSYKVMEQNGNFIKPAEVFIKILKPIYVADMEKEVFKTVCEDVRNLIIEEKDKMDVTLK